MGNELVGKIVVLNHKFKENCEKHESSTKYFGELCEIMKYNGDSAVEYLREFPYETMPLNNTDDRIGVKEEEFNVIDDNDPILLYEVGQDFEYLFHKTKITKIDYIYHMMEIRFENGVHEVIQIPESSSTNTVNTKLRKIALIGEAGSGKDFVANYLMENYDFVRLAFADKVKSIAADLFPTAYSSDKKPRELLQAVGTKMREIDPEVWIRTVVRKVSDSQPYVVTDLRMPNEYEALKNEGFTFIRLLTSEETRMKRLRARGDVFKATDLTHDTERHYDSFEYDFTIGNDETDDVKNQIDRILAL